MSPVLEYLPLSPHTCTVLTVLGCIQAKNDYSKRSGFDKSCEALREQGPWTQLDFTHIWQHLQKPRKHSAHKKMNLSFNIMASFPVGILGTDVTK